VTEGSDRRRHPRTKIVAQVIIHIENAAIPGSLLDISVGGLRAEAEIRLDQTEARIVDDMPLLIDIPALRLSNLRGKILRVNRDGIGHTIAAAFDQIRPEVAARLIDRLVKK